MRVYAHPDRRCCPCSCLPGAPWPCPRSRASLGPIDDYGYDHARKCVKKPAKGTLAMQSWLERNARGVSWGIMRCERLSGKNFSLHAEGRAIDWHLDARRPAERRAADRLIKRLLATDSEGNPHALARRMGDPGDHLELQVVVVGLGGHGALLALLRPPRQASARR